MLMLVNCSNCHTPLQLPPGARSIRCAICQAVTQLADPRAAPPPSHNQYNHPPPAAAPPSPYNHAPPGPPPNAHGRKKAVIVGVSYRYSRHELKGCLNDAKCMKYLLMNKFHFPEASILMLTGKNIGSFLAFDNYMNCINKDDLSNSVVLVLCFWRFQFRIEI